MRIILASLAGIVFVMAGFMKSAKIKQNLSALKSTLSFVTEVMEMIRYSAKKRDEIISEIISGEKYSLLRRSPPDILTEFSEGLGKSDTKGQSVYCEMFIRRLENEITFAENSCKDKEKLYKVLGISAGAAAAIMII